MKYFWETVAVILMFFGAHVYLEPEETGEKIGKFLAAIEAASDA